MQFRQRGKPFMSSLQEVILGNRFWFEATKSGEEFNSISSIVLATRTAEKSISASSRTKGIIWQIVNIFLETFLNYIQKLFLDNSKEELHYLKMKINALPRFWCSIFTSNSLFRLCFGFDRILCKKLK